MSLTHHAAIITPRHDGDDPTAFAIYPDSQTWFCFSCQRVHAGLALVDGGGHLQAGEAGVSCVADSKEQQVG